MGFMPRTRQNIKGPNANNIGLWLHSPRLNILPKKIDCTMGELVVLFIMGNLDFTCTMGEFVVLFIMGNLDLHVLWGKITITKG